MKDKGPEKMKSDLGKSLDYALEQIVMWENELGEMVATASDAVDRLDKVHWAIVELMQALKEAE